MKGGILKGEDEGGCHRILVLDKVPVEIGKPQEVLQLLARWTDGPVHDYVDLGGIHLDAACSDSEP